VSLEGVETLLVWIHSQHRYDVSYVCLC
jgi:hypothetical protein